MGDDAVIEKQARIIHRPDDDNYLDPVRRHVKMWADWRKSDLPPGLGYPRQSAEQGDLNHGVQVLPGWVIELTMDKQIMYIMKPELRRSLLALYAVPVRYNEGKDAGIVMSKMKYIEETGKYHWPTDMETTVECTAMKKPTLYAQHNRALYWIDGRLT